jgi:hypothetical protein
MRPLVLALSLVVLTASGLAFAGKKPKDPPPAPETTTTTTTDQPTFVDLSLDEEEEEPAPTLLVAEAECSDLRKMEPKAMMGKLSDPEIRCLDKSLRESQTMTFKDKVSRVLMADAYAKKHDDRWEAIARRHLNEIDRSDPDLCFKFSTFMFKKVDAKGPDAADEVMKWADVALENKQVWTGDTYVKRVSSLYKIKAIAAFKKWEQLEVKFKEKPDDTLGKSKEEARNEAKNLAREWLAYAKEASLEVDQAAQLCVSAAGTEDFCQI